MPGSGAWPALTSFQRARGAASDVALGPGRSMRPFPPPDDPPTDHSAGITSTQGLPPSTLIPGSVP